MPRAPSPERYPRCPRCGYALRGEVETWHTACPLEGRCPECGLDLRWSDVLVAERVRPVWAYEFAPMWRSFGRLLLTYLMVLVPWVFWRQMTMLLPPRWKRIAALLLFGLAATYLCLMVNLAIDACADHAVKLNRTFPTRPPPAWRAALWAAVAPLSDTSVDASIPYWHALESPRGLLLQKFSRHTSWRGLFVVLKAIAFPAMMSAIMALGFMLLPVSLRRAQVRLRQIIRVLLYSLIAVIAIAAYATFTHAESRNTVVIQDALLGILCFLIAPLWLVIWWGFAIRSYLRIEHSWGVAVSLGFIAWALLMGLGYKNFVVWHWSHVFLRMGFPVW